jgi:hypothetical protein
MKNINLNLESKSFTKEDFRKKAWVDHEFFCKSIFPEAFYVDFCEAHREIFNIIFSNERYVGVIAPRKLGKTPTICFSYPAKLILYNMETCIIIVSATQGESERHVMKLVHALETSEKVHYYYGNVVDRKNFICTREEVQFKNRIWLRSKGYKGQIRGTGGEWTPPSLIIVDDIQSNKDVKTPKSIQDAIDWFEEEIIYSIAQQWQHPVHGTLRPGKVRFLGTSLDPNCVAEYVYSSSRFKCLRYAICQNEQGEPELPSPYGHGKSIWEEMFPTASISKDYGVSLADGSEYSWLQEKFNQPRKFGDRVFNIEDTQWYTKDNLSFKFMNGLPFIETNVDME